MTLAATAPGGARRRVPGRHLPVRLAGLQHARRSRTSRRGGCRSGARATRRARGLRGLITSNVVRARARAARRAGDRHAQRARRAPDSRRFAGRARLRRRDCRYALQLYADGARHRSRFRSRTCAPTTTARAPRARPGRRLQAAHLQRLRRHPDRAARDLRRRRRPAAPARRTAPTTSAPTRQPSGSPTARPRGRRSSRTRRWPAANGSAAPSR